MSGYYALGPVPYKERRAEVADRNYRDRAIRDCRRYIEAIRRKVGPEPDGSALHIKSFPHEDGDGIYYEVVCSYDPGNAEAVEYARRCEADVPATWKEVGMTAPVSGRTRDRK